MIIPINEQYRITSDPFQWIIQKKRTRNGREDWTSQTFHLSFSSALQSLGERMVRESNASTLSEALADVKAITTTLSQALTPNSDEVSDIEKAGRD
jgi:hypothetical protein